MPNMSPNKGINIAVYGIKNRFVLRSNSIIRPLAKVIEYSRN